MNGTGRVTIGAESAPIATGDAVPIDLNASRAFENTGTTPLEFLVVGVAADPSRKDALLVRRPPPKG
jgi:mannose-6-phosphate isomerase-like protein (cupin superfamily)